MRGATACGRALGAGRCVTRRETTSSQWQQNSNCRVMRLWPQRLKSGMQPRAAAEPHVIDRTPREANNSIGVTKGIVCRSASLMQLAIAPAFRQRQVPSSWNHATVMAHLLPCFSDSYRTVTRLPPTSRWSEIQVIPSSTYLEVFA